MSLPDESTENPEEVKTQARKSRRQVVEWAAVILVAVLASFLIRVYAFQTFEVPSGSMLPTLQVGDRLVVDKLPWLAHSIHRGDIIVFHRAPHDTDLQYPILVKRVIGLPGETISSKGDTIYINGHPIAEPWLSALEYDPDVSSIQLRYHAHPHKTGSVLCHGRLSRKLKRQSLLGDRSREEHHRSRLFGHLATQSPVVPLVLVARARVQLFSNVPTLAKPWRMP